MAIDIVELSIHKIAVLYESPEGRWEKTKHSRGILETAVERERESWGILNDFFEFHENTLPQTVTQLHSDISRYVLWTQLAPPEALAVSDDGAIRLWDLRQDSAEHGVHGGFSSMLSVQKCRTPSHCLQKFSICFGTRDRWSIKNHWGLCKFHRESGRCNSGTDCTALDLMAAMASNNIPSGYDLT